MGEDARAAAEALLVEVRQAPDPTAVWQAIPALTRLAPADYASTRNELKAILGDRLNLSDLDAAVRGERVVVRPNPTPEYLLALAERRTILGTTGLGIMADRPGSDKREKEKLVRRLGCSWGRAWWMPSGSSGHGAGSSLSSGSCATGESLTYPSDRSGGRH